MFMGGCACEQNDCFFDGYMDTVGPMCCGVAEGSVVITSECGSRAYSSSSYSCVGVVV